MSPEDKAWLTFMLASMEGQPPWHDGRTVGRTIYQGDGPDDMIGVMDNRAIARLVVLCVNYMREHWRDPHFS